MFTFTRKIEYALVALAHLAKSRCENGNPASARAIAEQYNLPAALLMNLMKALQKAGIIASTRGANGGYYLARAPLEVGLTEIIEAVEGPLGLTPCCVDADQRPAHKQECEVNDCPARRAMHRLNRRMIDFMEQITLRDLVECEVDVGVQEVGVGDYDELAHALYDEQLITAKAEELGNGRQTADLPG